MSTTNELPACDCLNDCGDDRNVRDGGAVGCQTYMNHQAHKTQMAKQMAIDPRWADIDFDKVNAELRGMRDQIALLRSYIDRTQPVVADADGYVQPQAQGEAVDYNYQATFYAIAEAAKPSANGLAISVKKFWESYRAATHPQASEPAWRPIETAPKDSSRILVYLPTSNRPVQEVWWAIPYEGSTDGWWSTPQGPTGRGYVILPESPTHWQPLPAAPEVTNG